MPRFKWDPHPAHHLCLPIAYSFMGGSIGEASASDAGS